VNNLDLDQRTRERSAIGGMWAASLWATLHMLDACASALREGQTRREAGAQSLRASMGEVAGLPNSGGAFLKTLRPNTKMGEEQMKSYTITISPSTRLGE